MWSFKPMGEGALLVEAREPNITLANGRVLMLANAIATSAFAAANVATSSFDNWGRPESCSSTEKTTHAMWRDR
jgi:hypothetical protein